MTPMYQVRRPARSVFVNLRTLRYHVRLWGEPRSDAPPLVLVHGWMDVAASYQFVVDAMVQERAIIAPDWRGYGQTEAPNADHFVFADYLADLDFLLDHFAPGQAVDLVGHSLGGNVVMAYAGVRPARVRRLVNLEGFGLPATVPDDAPVRLCQWIDELKALDQGTLQLKPYASLAAVAQRLMKTNPRLAADKAHWLAAQWARAGDDGRWHIRGHTAHKVTSAQRFLVEDMLALYQRIACPVLAVEAQTSSLAAWWGGRYTLDDYHQRLHQVRRVQILSIPDAGHMLHHDQPALLANHIEAFLG